MVAVVAAGKQAEHVAGGADGQGKAATHQNRGPGRTLKHMEVGWVESCFSLVAESRGKVTSGPQG